MTRAMRERLLATTIIAGAAVLTAPAFAQTTPPAGAAGQAPTPSVAPAPAAAPTGGEIVVTGSRIPTPNLTSVSPVTVVSSQDIKLQGVTRVEDLLNSLPQVAAGQSSGLSNGATGTATVDLRGLGPTRTLVLINGRRLLPGDPGSSAADLNAVPSALIKRVEVLTGGASSTYGADAVAGVVNFIMDTDFTGIRLDSQYNFYQHDNHSGLVQPLLQARQNAGLSGYGFPTGNSVDGGTVDATLSMGAGFDDNRGHIVGYFGYRKVKAVTQNNRDYSACTIQNKNASALQCGGSATSNPANAFLTGSPGGGTTTAYTVGQGGKLTPGLSRYNFAPTNYFQRPDERYTGGFFAHYDVSDAIKPYMEFNFMDDRTKAQIAPSGDFGNTLTINCDNPALISSGNKPLVCDPGNLVNGFLGNFPLTANGGNAGIPTQFFDPTTGAPYNKGFFQVLRRNTEGGPRIADLEHTEFRGVIGAKGDLGSAWSYDAYYQYGRTIYSQVYSGEFSVSRLSNALDIVGDPNNPATWQCRVTAAHIDPNCQPYNLFGTPSQGAVNYVSATGFQHGIVTEQVASGSFTGQLGEYGIKSPWANDGVSINVGGEYRKETLDLQVDQEFSTGDLTGQGGATLPISGNYHVIEGFGELQAPLVHENVIYDLSLNAGYRRSHYQISNGNKFDTNTFKVGLEFAPVKDVRFRASYNRAVRAPNLQELFATQHVALDGSTDPCAGGFDANGTTVNGNTAAQCAASGVSAAQFGHIAANPAGQYNGLIGGTPSLKPEVSITKSFGAVFQPSFLPHFALTVDYYDIKVKGAVQGFGADAIANTCVATGNPTACSLIHRDPGGSLWLTPGGFITDLQQNIGSLHTKGID
ncbi:MAG TPA: TonB-dependent receptor, partial [Acetobacteraceae bacterium]|nr:TonB-dependent receptor [Acetobacteraceae bacterium]